MARRKKRRYRKIKGFVWLCIAAFCAFVLVFMFFVRPHLIQPGFEIHLPPGYNVHGIDVSRYQYNIDWPRVKQMDTGGQKIWFVFIKATEGVNNIDPSFQNNWEGARENGITRGAYHYFIAGKDPVKQADNFISSVNLKPGDLPPVLDIEKAGRLSVSRIQNDAQQWLDIVEQHYNVTPVIYTNVSFYEKYFNSGFEKYPLWIAHYKEPNKPRISKEWAIWQHAETGRVDGINAPVDFNVFNGDSTDFFKFVLPRKD